MIFVALIACKEGGRFEMDINDSVPPSKPEYLYSKPLNGGARLFYRIPDDRDLLSIDASYINANSEKVWFSVSYFKDSIDVYGFNSIDPQIIQLYAVDRAGNKSESVNVTVYPLAPAFLKVAQSITVKPGFGSFQVNWKNELEQDINVYLDFSYTSSGKYKEHHLVKSSRQTSVQWYIKNLNLTTQEPIDINVHVEDQYGNKSTPIRIGKITLLQDTKISKELWSMPETNDIIGGVPMAFLNGGEGRREYLIDDIIDNGKNLNYVNTDNRGRTGDSKDGNMPWNIFIDLGDYYELSRIITTQRYYLDGDEGRQSYYRGTNVGLYNIYIWDEASQCWEFVFEHKITIPVGLTEMEYKQAGIAGDEAYFFPDDPKFTKPTRWLRYEALKGFGGNYTAVNGNCLSEVTLYGRKVIIK